jgi:RNA polymerase sigma factor (sigma-70 family)
VNKNTEENNFGLTEHQFADLAAKLAQGDQRLFELAFLRHFTDCYNFLLQEDGAPADLAYDATMEALYNFRCKVEKGKIKYGNLRFLFTRMARQYYYKRLRKENHTSIEEIRVLIDEEEDVSFEEDAFILLRTAWLSLNDECKKLLHAFYYQESTLLEIASATAQGYAVVRKRKQRCVEKLRTMMKGAKPY